ncbi:hypothetical protein HMPREF1992_00687 [Selenomonas sp. oral taxon 892 str. F0426]|nr:hypothetical protein HMPREF1992_00687 [Selenomonas sp. oral taxon 892 str. F0426]
MICFVCLFAFCKEAFYFAPNAGCHDATYAYGRTAGRWIGTETVIV